MVSENKFRKQMEIRCPNVVVTGKYKGISKKISCKCKVCGYEWETLASVLTRGKSAARKGGGCPRCANVVKKTHEEFCSELKAIKPHIVLLTKYQGANKQIRCKCSICGYEWNTTPHVLLKITDSNCPNEAANKKKKHEEFVKELKNMNPDIELMTEYITAKDKINCKCRICGYEWTSTPDALRSGNQCQKCLNKRLHDDRVLSQSEFIERISSISPSVEIIGIYRGAAKRIACRCKTCGHEWAPYASNLFNGTKCPECARNKRKSQREFINESTKKNPHFKVIGDYINSKTKIKVECKICGKITEMYPDSILRGSKCSCQYPKRISLQEEFIAAAFESLFGLRSIRNKRDLIGREIDIFFDELNFAIEPGS